MVSFFLTLSSIFISTPVESFSLILFLFIFLFKTIMITHFSHFFKYPHLNWFNICILFSLSYYYFLLALWGLHSQPQSCQGLSIPSSSRKSEAGASVLQPEGEQTDDPPTTNTKLYMKTNVLFLFDLKKNFFAIPDLDLILPKFLEVSLMFTIRETLTETQEKVFGNTFFERHYLKNQFFQS